MTRPFNAPVAENAQKRNFRTSAPQNTPPRHRSRLIVSPSRNGAAASHSACYSALQRITAIYARLDPASDEPPFNPVLFKKVEDLEFLVRTPNCLKNDNILYVGDLVQKSDLGILRIPNMGRKGLIEIKEVLYQMGLHHLNMEVVLEDQAFEASWQFAAIAGYCPN